MKKFISELVKESHLNIKIHRDYVCFNKRVYKENYFSLIDSMMMSNDILQLRQIYYFIEQLTENDDKEYLYYFHQKYINKIIYRFTNKEGNLKYYLHVKK